MTCSHSDDTKRVPVRSRRTAALAVVPTALGLGTVRLLGGVLGVMLVVAVSITTTALTRHSVLAGSLFSTPSPSRQDTGFKNKFGMEFVPIPACSFSMGSEKLGKEEEKPVHTVTFGQSFFMGKCEVTQAQWTAVMGANPSAAKGDDLPVENVSWDDTQQFLAKLNALKDGYTYRLPTEAEWEYACRAGTSTHFAFGDALPADAVNFNGNYPLPGTPKGVYREKTIPVGSLSKPNAWGLFDMHGNVWEWCQDNGHNDYNGAPADGRAWETGGNTRMLRGGSYTENALGCRSTNRFMYSHGYRYNDIGFRVVAKSQK